MTKAKQLVDHCKSNLGVPYVYGMKMQVMTRGMYDGLKARYGSMVWDSDVRKVGQVCCDCSGLISSCTGVVQGSSQMKAVARACKPISTIGDAPVGALVWQQGHVGVYIGRENGVPMYIAEDGSAHGCRKMPVAKAKFTHWLLMAYIDTSEPVVQKDEGDDEMVGKVKVIVDGRCSEIPNILKDGTNYVNVRELAKVLGVTVGYDAVSKAVTLTK